MSEPKDDAEADRVHEAMLEALEPVELPPERAAAMKRRVLARVEAASERPSGHSTVRAGEGEWRSFMPKVRIKVLMQEGDKMSYLLRLEAGAMIPPHDHPQTEECVVLEGEVRIGEEIVHPGDYHVARGGHGHGLLRSDTGALLFLRGAVPSAKQVRWGSLDAYAPLIPQALRDKLGRWRPPE